MRFVALLTATIFAAGCGPNQRILNSANDRPPEPSTVRQSGTVEPARIENDIASMKTADFNFIYILRRMDGGELDADDRAFMNANLPFEINRKKVSDAGKALIIGSNFRLPPENFRALKERFEFEDLSKPENEIMSANSNGR